VSGYVETTRHTFDAGVLDRLIDRRVASLEAWLDDLDHTPTGTCTASPDWHSTLRAVIHEYNRTQTNPASDRTGVGSPSHTSL
jgi:hypothetical protein